MVFIWRYLKALHRDVKKGKWSLKEEEQLIDLVQKHGLGECFYGLISSSEKYYLPIAYMRVFLFCF